MKICSKCNQTKEFSEFYTHKTYAYQSRCKECMLEANRLYLQNRKANDPEFKAKRNAASKALRQARWRSDAEFRTRELNNQRLRLYGVTDQQFQTMMLVQCGKCAVCQEVFDFDVKTLCPHIDHDHSTGVVRGLLCGNCNWTLGLVKDSRETLQGAIEYLGGK